MGMEAEAMPTKSKWVQTILVLGHLGIILGVLAWNRSERREPPKTVGTGPSILECLRRDAADAPSR